MRKITYYFSLILVFMLPWEDSVSIATIGSLAKVVGIIVAGLWMLTILLEGRFRKPHLFHIFVLWFFLWNTVTIFWSPFKDFSLQRVKTYAQIYVLLLILWEMYQKPTDLISALQSYILGAFILIVSSISNYIKGAVAVAYEGRYSATGVNAVDLTLILILGLPIALHLFFIATKEKTSIFFKLLNLVYIPLAVFSILLSGSRTSLIAIIPFCIYIAATKQIGFQGKLFVFLTLIFSGVSLLSFLPQSVIARLGTVGELISSADLGGRVELWRMAITAWSKHLLSGIGGGAMDPTIGSAAHNTFLSVATETGCIGFILFLLVVVTVIYVAVKLPRNTSELWLAILVTWSIGVLSLSWEFRKITWIILSFVIIESSFQKQIFEQEDKIKFSGNTELSFQTSESTPHKKLN